MSSHSLSKNVSHAPKQTNASTVITRFFLQNLYLAIPVLTCLVLAMSGLGRVGWLRQKFKRDRHKKLCTEPLSAPSHCTMLDIQTGPA